MIWHTVPQAAEAAGVTERTIRRWISAGWLPVKEHPLVPGVRFVDDADLRRASGLAASNRGGKGRFTLTA